MQDSWIKLFTIYIVLMNNFLFAQTKKMIAFNGKQYNVYTDLPSAMKANPDSVEGLSLCSNGFKDFPVEILRFKKLKFLEICNFASKELKDILSKPLGIQKNSGKLEYENENLILNIPKGIKKLTALELVDFSSVRISRKAIHRLYKFLPKAERLPDYKLQKILEKNE